MRRSPFRIISHALNAYSSKHSSLDARTTHAFLPDLQRYLRGNKGNSLPSASTCSSVVNNQMPLDPGNFALSRSPHSRISSRYKYVKPNARLIVGRNEVNSSTTKGKGSRLWVEDTFFIEIFANVRYALACRRFAIDSRLWLIGRTRKVLSTL
jgi:hypothetical protein